MTSWSKCSWPDLNHQISGTTKSSAAAIMLQQQLFMSRSASAEADESSVYLNIKISSLIYLIAFTHNSLSLKNLNYMFDRVKYHTTNHGQSMQFHYSNNFIINNFSCTTLCKVISFENYTRCGLFDHTIQHPYCGLFGHTIQHSFDSFKQSIKQNTPSNHFSKLLTTICALSQCQS